MTILEDEKSIPNFFLIGFKYIAVLLTVFNCWLAVWYSVPSNFYHLMLEYDVSSIETAITVFGPHCGYSISDCDF